MSLRVVTRAMLAAEAAEKWREQYAPLEPDKSTKWEALVALGDNPNPDDVDAVIGNVTWTTLCCDCCHERGKGPWITFDEDDDETTICSDCIGLAACALREVTE